MDDEKTLRLVIDPALPQEIRKILLSDPTMLAPASGSPPSPPRRGGRSAKLMGTAFGMATASGFLPIVGAPILLGMMVGLPMGIVAQAGLGLVWWHQGFWTFMQVEVALQFLLFVLLIVFGVWEDERAEAARVYHGRYFLQADFAEDDRRWLGASMAGTMLRAQKAIDTVQESKVKAAGLLDDAPDEITLPWQEWEIAQSLAELSRVGRQLASAAQGVEDSERVKAATASQRKALQASVAAVTERVEALERYAERTHAADIAYREWQALQELAEFDDDAIEVLARSVRDELAVDEIDDLADQTGLATLRTSLREAHLARNVLAEHTGGTA
ncbi:hypothetical protein [Actinomadura oligospora]|uniref:hypothetical protein n=1 Tax=Actinomadura oligospora TaxID=111804 RepID=UPI0004B48EB9|nr:hypothetical protein [Actinomadura oligospora]